MQPVTPEIAVVFGIVLAALVLFATEPVPVDITALGVMVALLVAAPVANGVAAGLGTVGVEVDAIDPLVTTDEGISGFASTATITVLAMFVLSDGVQRTGVIQVVGRKMGAFTGDSETRQLGSVVGVISPLSGFINNTAAVAIMLPMVSNLAHEGGTSPSKLLIPLSYASMFGGTLTLIGTSTNILASEIAADIADPTLAPNLADGFSMFEFTALGAILTVVGFAYLLFVGRYLIPERIPPEADLTEEFEMDEYLTEVEVEADSPLIGQTVDEALTETDFDVDIVQLVRGDRVFLEPLAPKVIQAGDLFALRTDRDTLVELLDVEGLAVVPDVTLDEAELEAPTETQTLVEVVVGPGSDVVGDSLSGSNFRERYDATVLAIRRGGALVRQRLDDLELQVGDTLLIQATPESIERLDRKRDFIVAGEIDRRSFREEKTPVAIGIVLAVVGVAALTSIHIVTAALGGALGMVVTGCLKPGEVYDAVQWDVIILLAGVIPLGLAMQNTGAATLVADGLVAAASLLPPLAVLGLVYVVTALLTNVISNNASVVLMVPVGYQAAVSLGANPFSFVLAVTFAASTAFMTPVGYQTNLFVYGPGGYRFSDYLRVGTPLQALFAVATTLGIWALFGV